MIRRWRVALAATLATAGLAGIVAIEISFDRPPLSARPQVWLSKPVEWTFRVEATLLDTARDPSKDVATFTFSEFAPVMERLKNGAANPMWAGIQTAVLLNTLSKMDSTPMDQRLSVRSDTEVVWERERVEAAEYSDDSVVVNTPVDARFPWFAENVGRRVTIDLIVAVDSCAPRESTVSCPLADFSGADLGRGDFERANLRGADLHGVNFAGAKLAFADLSGAIGRDVEMSRALLIGIDIGDAFLERVSFVGAVWTR